MVGEKPGRAVRRRLRGGGHSAAGALAVPEELAAAVPLEEGEDGVDGKFDPDVRSCDRDRSM